MIPGLPQVGPMELIILLTILLLLFGANRIPELARSLGRGTREFRKGISEAGDEAEDDHRREKYQENPSSDKTSGSGKKAGVS